MHQAGVRLKITSEIVFKTRKIKGIPLDNPAGVSLEITSRILPEILSVFFRVASE